MKKIATLSVIMAAAMLVSACSPRLDGNTYAIRGVGEVNRSERGIIVAARPVTISGSKTSEDDNKLGDGAVLGAGLGALGGSMVGNGRGQLLAAGLGAVAGGVAGHYAGRALTDQEGVEYQIQLDSGELVSIAQGVEPRMSVGQRVLVISSDRSRGRLAGIERGRVVPDNSFR